MQTTYNTSPAAGFPGMLADNGPNDVLSRTAAGAVPFGRFVVELAARKAGLVPANVATVTVSTDFVASNSTVGDVTVTAPDGTVTPTTLSATVFATDHATTLAAIATKIAAVAGIESATADAANDKITVVAKPGYSVALSAFVTTGGAGQPTFTYTQTGDLAHLAGIALHRHKEPDSSGVAQYKVEEVLDLLKRGRVWMQAEEAVSVNDPVYIRVVAGAAGQLVGQVRKSADSGKAVLAPAGIKFGSDTSAAGVVVVNINLP